MTIPTVGPAAAARVLPSGIPILRRKLLDDLIFYKSGLDDDATPGDPGLFGPGSATWQVMSNAARPLGGTRAGLMQAMLAPVPAAVESTAGFANDLLGRISRTSRFVQQMNLGSIDEVYRGLRRVRAMHRGVQGTSPDGIDFDATDVDLQAWVSMTFTDSLLVANQRFGRRRLDRSEADRFVWEQSLHGALLDERVDLDAIFDDPVRLAAVLSGEELLPSIFDGRLPTTVSEMRAKLASYTSQLSTTPVVTGLVDGTLEERKALPRWQQPLIDAFVTVALSTLPDELYEIAAPNRARPNERRIALTTQALLTPLQAAYGRGRPVEVAYRRVRTGAAEPRGEAPRPVPPAGPIPTG